MADIHNKLISRRISKGHNAADSAKLLAEVIAAHSGDNLVTALVYNEFATEAQATKIADIIDLARRSADISASPSDDKFALYRLCPECKGGGSEEVGGCSTCLGDNVVKTEAHVAALSASKATGLSLADAIDMMRRAGKVEDSPRLGYANTIKRDGAAFATTSSWSDALAVAQATSRVYKRSLFVAEGALGQRMAYRGGAVQR